MDIDKSLLETEIKEIEHVEAEQAKEEQKIQENEIREQYQDTTNTLKPVVQRLHTLVFHDVLQKDVADEVLGEMSNCFLEILDKYLPQADWIGKYGPEIAYIGLIGVAMTSSNKKENVVNVENEQI